MLSPRSLSIWIAAILISAGSPALAQSDDDDPPTQSEEGEPQAPGDDLPAPAEPWLPEAGNWAADFNEAQIACYQGSMRACDSIWLSKRVLFGTFLDRYGHTCGGRVENRARDHCIDIFPGHE